MDKIVFSVNSVVQTVVINVNLVFVKYVNKIIIYKIINVLNRQ